MIFYDAVPSAIRVAVERKTMEDFAASLIDGRLFSQAISLKNAYAMPMILIEGETIYTWRDVRTESIMGALASLMIGYGIPILWARNPVETALLLISIARREQKQEGREPRVRAEPKPATLKEMQEYVVASLPSVDAVRGRKLLEKFGSVEKVFTASGEELQEVEGIGEKISESIRKVLSAKYAKEGS